MRALFSFAGGSGHFEPLVPIARAARAAGHVVAFAGRPALRGEVEAAGFDAFAVGEDLDAPPRRLPLLTPSVEREERVLRDGFAGRIARERLAAMAELSARWRPDVLVRDELDFGAAIAAERLGLPHATVLVIASGAFVRPRLVAAPLDALRAEHGLPPDPQLTATAGGLVLSPFPPGFRDPAFPLPPVARSLRPAVLDAADGALAPAWLRAPRSAPLVHVTLGTVFNMESGDLFARVVAGLRELPLELIVSVGRHVDPAELGPQPPHVRVERHVPHAALLPHCALAVSHGGSGSVAGALAHGLPSLLLPLGADQPLNAARVVALGVGRALDPVAATPAEIRDAAATLLGDRSARVAAARLRAEAAALPPAAHAVALLERLATTRRV